MEGVNIISKEVITAPISWPTVTIAILLIASLIGILIYLFISKNYDNAIKYLAVIGLGGILVLFLVTAICAIFFRVPTSRYKYKGTIDKDTMTISQYEEFKNQYNFRETMKKGIYYWEDPIE